VSGPARDELNAIDIITDNVARAIAWARDPNARTEASDILPRQVAALQALTAAISQQGSGVDAETREAIDAVVEDSRRLAEIVGQHLAQA
jgi:hypothetical protein